MTTTDTGVANNDTFNGDDDDAITAALSKAFGDEDAETPSKADQADDETDEQSEDTEGSKDKSETEGDDGDEKSTEGDEDEDEDKEADEDPTVVVKDEYKVKVPVDGKEVEHTIGSLKRLAGQEAALTRKSQEVATKRTQLDQTAATHVAALKVLMERADKRFEPYAKLDFFSLAKDPNISQEELTAIREAATAAYQDKQFLTQEMGAFTKALQDQRAAEIREQAAETVKVLSDPEKGIQGFNEKLYGDMISFAKSQGVPDDAASEIVDPISLKILHMAMLYERGAKKVKTETDPKTTSKKKTAPKKIVKNLSNTETNKKVMKGSTTEREQAALKRLARSGSDEDAIAAFEAMAARDDD